MQGVLTSVCRTSMKTLALNPACTYNQTWSSQTELRYQWGCKGASLKKNLRFYWRRRFFLSHSGRKCHCEGVSPKQSPFKWLTRLDEITSFNGRHLRLRVICLANHAGVASQRLAMTLQWSHDKCHMEHMTKITKRLIRLNL